MMSHTFSIGDRCRLQAGQSNTFTLSLRNHTVVAHSEWYRALSWSNHGLPVKGIILMAACLCTIPIYGTFAHMPVTMLLALLHHHSTTDACFCICCWWKSGWSLWSLGLRTGHPFFPETSWNVNSSYHGTHFHGLFKRFKLHFLMQQQTVVNGSGFLKYSWAHVAIFNTAAWRFLMQCHLRAQRSCTFTALPYMYWDFFGIPWIFSQ